MTVEPDIRQYILIAMIGISVAGFVIVLLFPLFAPDRTQARLKSVAESRKPGTGSRRSGAQSDGQKDSRGKQLQEKLKSLEEREKRQRKRLTVAMLITQAGLVMPVRKFWVVSAFVGLAFAVLPLLAGVPWFLCVLSGFVGFFGAPRWFLGMLRKRRQEKFRNELADAIDIMVRGLRSGLPVSDAIRVIASEVGPPVGPEFMEVVEGTRVGITIEQGLERMFDRMPLQEVSFLAIVLNLQSKTGGSLTETLANLSKVLRDRRKMKTKIQSVSQEAKSSAAIIGALPFLIGGLISFLNPEYIAPMIATGTGNLMLIGCGVWMLIGIFVMKKMINFDI